MTEKIYIIFIAFFLFAAGCEKQEKGVIEIDNNSPYLLSARVNVNSLNLDHDTTGTVDTLNNNRYKINITAEMKGLKHSVELIPAGNVQIVKPFSGSSFANYAVPLQSVNSDTLIYSSAISFVIQRADIGYLRFIFSMQTADARQSNIIEKSLLITRRNSKPEITFVNIPDSLTVGHIPSPDSMYMVAVTVSDSDGIGDIKNVELKSKKPDGTFANCGNPIPFYDDGSEIDLFPPYDIRSGDAVAGDGIFSRKLRLVTSSPRSCPPYDTLLTQRGIYTFTFIAVDNNSDTSDTEIKTIKIK